MGVSRSTDKTEGAGRRRTVHQSVPHHLGAFRPGLFKRKTLEERKLFLALAGKNQATRAQSIVEPFGIAAEVSAASEGKLFIGLATCASWSDRPKTAVTGELLIAGIWEV